MWFFHYLIAWESWAAAVNRIVTVADRPIAGFHLRFPRFRVRSSDGLAANCCGAMVRSVRSIFDQVTDTMLVTTFVFLGVEGASVCSSSHGVARTSDAQRCSASSVLAIFASVTMVSYGVLPRQDLANTHPPSMAAVLESVVGSMGFDLHQHRCSHLGSGRLPCLDTDQRGGLVHAGPDRRVMPKFLARNNKNNTPIAALITTNVAVQALLSPCCSYATHWTS